MSWTRAILVAITYPVWLYYNRRTLNRWLERNRQRFPNWTAEGGCYVEDRP